MAILQDLMKPYSDFKSISSAAFNINRFVYFPQFLSTIAVGQWLCYLQYLPVRRVSCGIDNVTWLEQLIDDQHPIAEVLQSQSTLDLIKSVNGRIDAKLTKFSCWSCYYDYKEYINQHVDKSGDIQLLVCLTAPIPEKGGLLNVVDKKGAALPILMKSGDALIFEATTLPHFTTPIKEHKNERFVVAARYYF